MTDTQIDIRDIKETIKKMQLDIKRLEDSIPFYHPPTLYQYSPECFNRPTQGCSQEELIRRFSRTE